jgi:POT family proton-dependent oligopeptide transporter
MLFNTELWERFSYYGMRAILLYYIYSAVSDGGLGYPRETAMGIVSIYGSLVFMSSAAGGWLADRVMGAQRAVLIGGFLIIAGHIVLALPLASAGLFASIAFIVAGTGMLKPNIAALVGMLYGPGDTRRDSGYSIYYLGINIGAMAAPLVVGTVGQKIGFHWGFSLAAVGMMVALGWFLIRRRRENLQIGIEVPNRLTEAERRQLVLRVAVVIVGFAVICGVAAAMGELSVDLVINILSMVGVLLPIGYFIVMLRSPKVSASERAKIYAYVAIFASAIVFWSLEEQGSSILADFAANRTRLEILGIPLEASWFQSLNGGFIVILTPFFVWLWNRLGPRQPSTLVKFTLGLILTGGSFIIMMFPGMLFGTEGRVSPLWLVACFFVMICGELLISPVGLSVTGKLAPKAFQSQVMAMWLLADGASQAINAQIAKFYTPATESAYFLVCGIVAVLAGFAMFAIRKPISRLMQDVR